ncbi:hypothetical protein [Mycobacteroides abscessus]|uniref:hypothetical protein n=1 Tax=Mycobacteroides abscessus TaxID=36809 RepID=UPI001F442430|nr:hypothetical protein [Mycobacteroides abscessus]
MTTGHVSHQTPNASVVVALGPISEVSLTPTDVEVKFEGGTTLTVTRTALDDIMRERVHQAVAEMDREKIGAER